MFPENIVPDALVSVLCLSPSPDGGLTHHSVSALGSSIGTLTGMSGICMMAVWMQNSFVQFEYKIDALSLGGRVLLWKKCGA